VCAFHEGKAHGAYQRHKPPQGIGAMGHPAFVADQARWLSQAGRERNDTSKIAIDERPGGPVVKTSAQPGRAGGNPEDDLSAVGAALNRYRLFQHLQIEGGRLHAVHLANLA